MKLAFYIARRYLISKKSVNVINIISAISVIGVAVGTMALIVVLSAFNGIDTFISSTLSSFDPDLKITVAEGKSFTRDEPGLDEVMNLENVAGYTFVVEDNALLEYEGRQKYAIVKGVEDGYGSFSGIDSTLIAGWFLLENDSILYTILGRGVAYDLSVGMRFEFPVQVLYPKRETGGNIINLQNALNKGKLFPSGIFSIHQEIDENYILVPIDFARSIFELKGKVTSLELKLKKGTDPTPIKKQVKKILGERFKVLDRYEQHAMLYKVMRSEKWSSFMILGFILIVASFNLLGSLTMIIIEKKDDIFILESMGANRHIIRLIFLFEGWLISISGAVIGLLAGVGLVWAQKKFELLKLPGEGSFAVAAYPVDLQFFDVMATFLIVLSIGVLAAWYPVSQLGILQLSKRKAKAKG